MKTIVHLTKIAVILTGIAIDSARSAQIVDPPLTSTDIVWLGESTLVTITAQIAADSALMPASVNLVAVDTSDRPLSTTARMYDDGTHGDALKGDGSFTAQVLVNQTTPAILRFAVTSAYKGSVSRAKSATVVINVVRKPTDAELQVATDGPVQGQTYFDTREALVGSAQARLDLVTYLRGRPGVASVGFSPDGFTVWIVFNSGLEGSVDTSPFGTKAAPSGGGGSSVVYTGNGKSIALAPFFDYFSSPSNGGDETDSITQALTQTLGGTPDIFKNGAASVSAFSAMTGHGIVSISAHGNVNRNYDVIILTSEQVTIGSRLVHLGDWVLGRIENSSGYWAIRPSFIRSHVKLPDSLVYVSSCCSFYNSTMSSAFLQAGAKTYFGYDWYVNTSFSFPTGVDLFAKLTDQTKTADQKTASIAFNALSTHTDGHSVTQVFPPTNLTTTRFAHFLMSGEQNLALLDELVVNGRFETGNLDGWTSDTTLGYVKNVGEQHYEGTRSARIGRWDQLYAFATGFRGGSVPGVEPSGQDYLYQDVDLPAGAPKFELKFSYMVDTFDGANYDWFDAQVRDANTGAVLANLVNHIGGIIRGSPSNWGEHYTTSWIPVTYDLTPFKGRKIRLFFGVTQDGYGDQCAAYVDGVSIKSHN